MLTELKKFTNKKFKQYAIDQLEKQQSLQDWILEAVNYGSLVDCTASVALYRIFIEITRQVDDDDYDTRNLADALERLNNTSSYVLKKTKEYINNKNFKFNLEERKT